jgi:hypothetical protein
MRFIIESRIVDEESSGKPVVLAEFGRKTGGMLDGARIGMTLQEGHKLLREAQQVFAQAYVGNWLCRRSVCDWCRATYSHKDMRTVVYRTVFGRVDLPSPRWLECLCKCHVFGRQPTWSPMTAALPQRVSPQLEQLQVRVAAHLPYAQAVALLKDVLPLEDCTSVSGTKNRVRAVADALDHTVTQGIEALPKPRHPTIASATVKSMAVDSVWLRHCQPGRAYARQVSVAAARATLADGSTRLCGYFRAAQLTAQGMREQLPHDSKAISMRLDRAKWRLWHGRAKSAIEAISSLPEFIAQRCTTDSVDGGTLLRNIDKLQTYLESNERYLVNYGRRYRAGLPISSAPAESAVNQLVSARMAKKRQMRWSDEGAHALVQVRAALLNGDLKERARPVPWYRTLPSYEFQFSDSDLLAA